MANRPAFISEPLWRKCRLGADRLKIIKRQVLRLPKSPRLVIEYSAYRQAIKNRDWVKVLVHVKWITEFALNTSDRRLISEMASALERLNCYPDTATLHLAARQFVRNKPPNEWGGEDLSGKKLLVNLRETKKQGLGFAYRAANLIAKVAKRARHVSVVVEPRLLQTYRRSFPELEIVDFMDEDKMSWFDFVAAFGNLAGVFAPKANIPDPDFYPLCPDQARVAALRTRYETETAKPLIGLCWYSGHHGKLLPELFQWRNFIENTDALFVSLQYGDVSEDLKTFGSDRVISDPSIDQMVDMDRFAAQVAALDGIITITATLAHVAGALGVPIVAIRDDWFRREWPVMSDRVPWYPNLRVVGKDGREWDVVLDETWTTIRGLIADRSERS